MTPEVEKTYTQLHKDLVMVASAWGMYKDLYHHNAVRINLLTASASFFFQQLHGILLDHVLLGIARLSDKDKRSDTRSLKYLGSIVANAQLRKALEEHGRRLLDICDPIITHRNKRIAHGTTLSWEPELLPELTVGEIDWAIQQTGESLNLVAKNYGGTSSGYDTVIPPFMESVDGLVHALQKAAALDVVVPDQLKHHEIIAKTPFKDA